jgi:hypothetical protein
MCNDERTRAYAERRRAEGLSHLDIMRCLKRYTAREMFTLVKAALEICNTVPPPTWEWENLRGDGDVSNPDAGGYPYDQAIMATLTEQAEPLLRAAYDSDLGGGGGPRAAPPRPDARRVKAQNVDPSAC